MSYRTVYLICYDISQPKRQRKVRERLAGWRLAGQKSVFECWMTRSELDQTIEQIKPWLDPAQDRLHVFQLDPRMKVEASSPKYQLTASPIWIVG